MASGLNLNLDLDGITKLAQDISTLREKANQVDQLKIENERLRRELLQVPNSWTDLLNDNHLKQARIDALEKQLRSAQIKIQKWRQKYALSSSLAGPEDIRSDMVTDNNQPSEIMDAQNPPPSRVPSTTMRKGENRMRNDQKIIRPPLQEMSGNSVKSSASTKRKGGNHSANAIPLLAEDGEGYKRIKREPREIDHGIAQTAAHRRVDELLSQPSPALPILNATFNTTAIKGTNTPNSLGGSPRFLPLKRPTSTPKVLRRPSSFLLSKARTSAGAEDLEPFRFRPLYRLGLSHFKLNPANNDGLDYAFSEVVRDREQRKCLPSCTRPNCCGSTFKALASGIDLQISEQDLLKSMLGPDSDERIRSLTSVARENLVKEARTNLAANLYGKHRSAHERAHSPPGFWRTGMPGSQEEMEDKQQAEKKEREEVERRYNEARRWTGRWIFADE